MSKHIHPSPSPLATLSVALLFSLFCLAACVTGPGSSTQTIPAAVNTAAAGTTAEEITTPDTETPDTGAPQATGGFDCAGVTQIPSAECAALVALYNSTQGPDWADNRGWLATNTPCTWLGITCAAGHISDIHLLYNRLTGTLPPELGNLSHLRVLGLWVNQLHGPIPAELGNLSDLIFLDLSNNQLTGSLPAELGHLANLQTLSLAHNQLSGSLPSTLGNLASLEQIDLSYNQFSDPIPPELGNLANLTVLRLSHNQLSGSIPATWDSLSKLYELDLSYNRLHGPVPESLAHIAQRSLWGNALEGSITGSGQASLIVDYKNVHFTADPSLAESIWPEVIPATSAAEGEPLWYVAPEHLRFTFAGPPLVPGRSRMGINLTAEAQILVYPLAELAALDPWVQAQIDALQSLLAEQGPAPEGPLPLLPMTNASQVFQAQVQYLVFDNIRGLRFITQHAQEARPVNNQELFYTFQGFTGDGAYYVAAFFPVTTTLLPDTIEVDDWDAFSANFAPYLLETTTALDQLPPAEFRPNLTLLDAVITSLQVEPDSALFGE